MDSSGRIHSFSDDLARKVLEDQLKEKLVPIPEDEVEKLKSATQEERLAWYAKQQAYNHHASDEERNAAKAERRGRAGK